MSTAQSRKFEFMVSLQTTRTMEEHQAFCQSHGLGDAVEQGTENDYLEESAASASSRGVWWVSVFIVMLGSLNL